MLHKKLLIKNFLFSQNLADGIRITVEIILPAIIFSQFGKLDVGLVICVGALCVSISDSPGPLQHKKNGMFYCNLFVFLMALLTGFANHNVWLLGVLVIIASFFFTMFTIYGNRSTFIGTAALLVIILRMSDVVPYIKAIEQSFLILAGGIWYMLVALLFYKLNPYRPAQRSLGQCIHETAKYLLIKAELYNVNADAEDEYKKLLQQQVTVNESQDAVRELLYKNRALLKESIRNGRKLVLTFVDVVDLFEHITATWYDYSSLRKSFSDTAILNDISQLIKDIAGELHEIAYAIQSNSSYKKKNVLNLNLENLSEKIVMLAGSNHNVFVLKKILVNLRNIIKAADGLTDYFYDSFADRKLNSNIYYSKFVAHQKIDATQFVNNITLNSSVFRHSLRMMITCATGYIISKFLPDGHHSYWILLTIIVILKPGFSLTKQRNFDRFIGTIAGGIIGLLLLHFIHDRTVLFSLIVFFMIGAYSFQRQNYIVMVIFLTPYILILFYFLGLSFINVAEERLMDTAIGSALALIASYLLFPNWESGQITTYMASMMKANINYLYKISDYFSDKVRFFADYKLTRKEVYLSSANLSSAFNRMLSEPKSKQRNGKEIYEFVALNHTLSSNIAGLIANPSVNINSIDEKDILQSLRRSIYVLESSYAKLTNQSAGSQSAGNNLAINAAIKTNDSNNQLFDQLDFIYKLTKKIDKTTSAFLQ